MALLTNPRVAQAVDRIEDAKPPTCPSVDRNSPIVINVLAWSWVTTKDTRGKAQPNLLGICAKQQRTESIVAWGTGTR